MNKCCTHLCILLCVNSTIKSKPILNLIYDIYDEVLGTKCATDQSIKLDTYIWMDKSMIKLIQRDTNFRI